MEDRDDNDTRFVWLAREGEADPAPAAGSKTSIVFWGVQRRVPRRAGGRACASSRTAGSTSPASSRGRGRVRLGHYLFFADLEGHAAVAPVPEALEALARRVETLRMLGSYPAWTGRAPR